MPIKLAKPARFAHGAVEINLAPFPGEGIEATLGKHIVPQPDGCWLWKDRPDKYGTVAWHGKTWRVHRLIYCMFHRLHSIPSHLHVSPRMSGSRMRSPGSPQTRHASLTASLVDQPTARTAQRSRAFA